MNAPLRIEYRLALSDVERGVDLAETLIVGLQPEESLAHLTLRVLAWSLLYRPEISFARGPAAPDDPDLWAHDLTGRVVAWIECGLVSGEKLRHVVRHQRGAEVHVVTCDLVARESLLADLVRHPPGAPITVWTLDQSLVDGLAAIDLRRHKWAITVSGGHLYVDADGVAYDGSFRRQIL